ncbi:MAG: substrate-binding domain-containing protein [Micrococcales bacterium]
MSARLLKVVTLAIGASCLLTACDPPMPPEVKAALAEQTYTCEPGDTQLFATESIAAVAGDWQAAVESNCAGMTITPVADLTDKVELQIGGAPANVYSSVPFAVDAVVIAVNLPDITNVSLSADVLEKIWAGQISAWDDPAIAKLNAGFTLPATPITFGNELDAVAAKPLTDWLTRLAGHQVALTGGNAKLSTPTEGSLVVTAYSSAMALGVQLVGIDGVIPEVGSINSGASMYQAKTSSGNVTLSFNPKAKPIAPEGVAVAPAPYQALWVINLNLCGTDSLKTRAAARYLLRQDSQGSLGLSTVVALPENLRIVALAEVSKGLPEPVITAVPNQ